MKRKFTAKDSRDFSGALEFLRLMWGVETDAAVDLENGRGTVRIWLPGTEVVLHLESIEVRRLRVIERNKQRFPDRGNRNSHDTNCPPDPRS
jgi:hypothetical protein